MYMEGRIKAPGAQPSPGVNTASKRPGAEPTISGVSQVAFADVAGVDSGKQPSSAPGGPEKGPRPRESSEDGPLELRPREQMRPAGPGKKQSAPQEGPGELQAGREQAKPRSELGALPSRVPAAPERKQTAAQQGRQQNPGTVKGQVLQSHQQGPACQPSPGQQTANGPDIAQPVETSCILDSCGQRPGDKLPKRVDTPHIRPQEALLEPGPGGQKESPPEAMPLKYRAAPEENTADSFSPSTPGPEPLKGRVKTVETEPAPRPVPPPEVRDPVQKRPPEPTVAAGAQTLGNLRQGFMKCLLQVEEEEATSRRAAKARRSPRTLTPVPASAPQSLSPALPQSPASAPAMAPSWARAPATRGSPGLALGPFAGLDTGWRRAEPWSGDRSLTGTKARQELEERGLFTLYQTWDERLERLEEQLTVRQEEAFRSYFEIFNGHGEVDPQSLGNILLLVGISLTPAQVEDALMSADVDGDGRVGFKDFLAVLTDTRRFFCSVEKNALADMAPPNPHTLFFEILSLLVEMLALPETALEEITNYYQKKLKEGTCKAREMELAIGRLRSRKKLPYNPQEADLEVPERRVLRILSRLKQQNYAANLQSPYAQVPCIPLCPRLDKKMVRRKQGSQYVLDPCTPASLGPDIHSLLFQSGSQGSREHGSECRKWLSSVPARMH